MTMQPHEDRRGFIPDTPFRMEVEPRDATCLVRLHGSCTMEVSNQLGEKLRELAEDDVNHIILDMTDLDFIESTGLGGVVSTYLRCRRRSGDLKLVGPRPPILAVLQLTRLTQLFPVFDSIDDALAAGDRPS